MCIFTNTFFVNFSKSSTLRISFYSNILFPKIIMVPATLEIRIAETDNTKV